MTTAELSELKRKAEAGEVVVLDSAQALALVNMVLLQQLGTPRPEEVARDYDAVRTCEPGHDAALARLRAGAARAQTMEADNAALTHGLIRHLMSRDELHEDGVDTLHELMQATRDLLNQPHPGAALLERLHTAESERDSLREEMNRALEELVQDREEAEAQADAHAWSLVKAGLERVALVYLHARRKGEGEGMETAARMCANAGLRNMAAVIRAGKKGEA